MITSSIVTYKTKHEDLDRLIKCASSSIIDKIIIIDNSPTDILKDFVLALSPKVSYTFNNKNAGYGIAHNVAMRESISLGARYHIVLNPDIYFEPYVIQSLAEYMDKNEDVGMVSPKVFYPNGKLQYLCKLLPTPFDFFAKRVLPKKWTKKRMDRFDLKFTSYENEMNIPYLSGCFMYFRISALEEVGLFYESIFMYLEDCDISRRIHQKYRTMFYPSVSIVHAHEAASYKSFKMLLVLLKNAIIYFNKWGWFFDKERRRINKELLAELGYKNNH